MERKRGGSFYLPRADAATSILRGAAARGRETRRLHGGSRDATRRPWPALHMIPCRVKGATDEEQSQHQLLPHAAGVSAPHSTSLTGVWTGATLAECVQRCVREITSVATGAAAEYHVLGDGWPVASFGTVSPSGSVVSPGRFTFHPQEPRAVNHSIAAAVVPSRGSRGATTPLPATDVGVVVSGRGGPVLGKRRPAWQRRKRGTVATVREELIALAPHLPPLTPLKLAPSHLPPPHPSLDASSPPHSSFALSPPSSLALSLFAHSPTLFFPLLSPLLSFSPLPPTRRTPHCATTVLTRKWRTWRAATAGVVSWGQESRCCCPHAPHETQLHVASVTPPPTRVFKKGQQNSIHRRHQINTNSFKRQGCLCCALYMINYRDSEMEGLTIVWSHQTG
ncbi:hypothetical protein E2C01_010676 [Portunus trituberculatus]|uniref:Uncharacterized protein n=1 Tax=Portunus trituberculatus TaxID=210409 RepID=A0A5B7D930_PORTR|nr:hypothetical protein [Portunus trituberculatus]